MMISPEKTLVIRLSSIGDILLSSPLLRAYRRRFPDGRLDYLVKSGYADLVRYNPHLSSIIEFPQGSSFTDLRALRHRVRATGYDLIIDIHDSLRSRFIAWGHHNVTRVHKRKTARTLLVRTGRNLYASLGGSPGVAERYLETVSHLGITNDGKGLELFLPPQTDNEIRKHLASLPAGRRVIGMAPSAMHRNKMWPADRFAETAASIADEHDGAILLFGSAEDRNLCAEVQRMIKQRCSGAYVLNLAGETSLLQAGALMDRCDVVVTNDSGLMHLAAARKRKIVAIFGPTVKEFGFFPYGTTSTVVEVAGLPCRPCTHIGLERCPKRHFRCMNDISSAAVTGAVRAFLQST